MWFMCEVSPQQHTHCHCVLDARQLFCERMGLSWLLQISDNEVSNKETADSTQVVQVAVEPQRPSRLQI